MPCMSVSTPPATMVGPQDQQVSTHFAVGFLGPPLAPMIVGLVPWTHSEAEIYVQVLTGEVFSGTTPVWVKTAGLGSRSS